ncbi:hypothetical protein ABZV75_25935 [Streptomyces flaveolus]|uniref:hypothetical protein n=1 Tax=Streptomyces flaveolus TaxID=67297 RepID=UPI0033BDE0AC
MLRLGAAADEVPRETVYSYATRNPRGPRRRSFADTPGEHVFIDEVTAASYALDDAIRHCSALPAAAERSAADDLAAIVHERLRDFAARLPTVNARRHRTASPVSYARTTYLRTSTAGPTTRRAAPRCRCSYSTW